MNVIARVWLALPDLDGRERWTWTLEDARVVVHGKRSYVSERGALRGARRAARRFNLTIVEED